MTSQNGEIKVVYDGRPKRENVIEKDEIISLIRDLEILDSSELYKKHFSTEEK